MRRDQILESTYLRGSGLPIPLNGCWQVTSTKSKILLTLAESFFAHQSRCSRISTNFYKIGRYGVLKSTKRGAQVW